ncbi:DNA-binding transcriptional regulator NtrC [Dyadobacter sp. CECT 9623]|uniref:DNA-binding transcriptional regulator NtrC n=1 Tax=Dyadobacter linearis TaxID=2823330 RepID=A0ABN7R8N7_9BACT|nr:response regulator [Dyadobacter sp. CECT 9623]CAG5068807.1 DNA-binding transcriptional regulator NtrC [Dyadobacter sp. CECT 9623]
MPYQNILLIDDDEDDQEIFLSALENVSNSVNCVTISNAVTALEKLSRRELETDLIFLDLNMPLMNGQEFLIELKNRQELRDIPVIILSTSSNVSTIQHSKQLGAADFIKKPDSFDELVHILKSVLI